MKQEKNPAKLIDSAICVSEQKLKQLQTEIADFVIDANHLKCPKNCVNLTDYCAKLLEKRHLKKVHRGVMELEKLKVCHPKEEKSNKLAGVQAQMLINVDLSDYKFKMKKVENPWKAKYFEFLRAEIKKKREDLECPICLKTSTVPIFMCQQQHIICGKCFKKVCAVNDGNSIYRQFCRLCRSKHHVTFIIW